MEESKTKKEDVTEVDSELVVYELGYHLLPTVVEDRLTKEVDIIKSVIEKGSGNVIAEDFPKSMQLAYTVIRREGGKRLKFDNSYFGWIKFEMLSSAASAAEEALRENEKVLRFILIKTVREQTLAPKKVFFEKTKTPTTHLSKPTVIAPAKKEEQKSPISEAELDKQIEELVVE